MNVNKNQHGNPILSLLKSFEFKDIEADYLMGNFQVLFLSAKYHQLHPEYIENRMSKFINSKVLLLVIDVEIDLKELNLLCIKHDFTLVVVNNLKDAAKMLDNLSSVKSAEIIKKKTETDLERVQDLLPVNKTDVLTLLNAFKSINKIASASRDEISLLPGFGDSKVRLLIDAFDQPFSE